MSIEGEITIHDPSQIEFQEGTITFNGGKARFQIREGNEDIFFQAGPPDKPEVIHVFSYPGYDTGQVTIADLSLRIASSVITEKGDELPQSSANLTLILERAIPQGRILEIERTNRFSLTIRNSITQN